MTRFARQRQSLTVVLAVIGALTAAAQTPPATTAPPARGQGMGGMMYDKATETTVTGTVTEVKTVTETAMMGGRMADSGAPGRMMGAGPMVGVHLMVTLESGPVEVHLGPQTFLTEQKYMFAVNDRITVTGSRTKQGGTEAILARQIRRGDSTMTFRDATGRPLWAGRGRMAN